MKSLQAEAWGADPVPGTERKSTQSKVPLLTLSH